jgi:DNA repair exonuclease SbcCD nuclease subunit
MTRVIHTADTHLGYRQYHFPERRADFLAAFRRVVADAREDPDVDAVVHAGDLFHDRQPGLEDLMGTISVLRELRDSGIPFLAVVGNHEGTRTAQWLDLLATLDLATRLGREPVVVGDTAFYGLDYVPQARRGELDYAFEPHDAERAALVSHGAFEPFPHATWDTEEILAASPVDFDAVLLGDNHHPDRAEVDETLVTYSGSTERASAEEREPRGYNLLTFGTDSDGEGEDESGSVSLARRGIETREYVFLDLELQGGEGVERVRERIRQEDVEDAVVVVTLEGEGERVPPAEIEPFGEERGALVTRVNDRRDLPGDEAAGGVSFADPDDAVRERVREMGLSEAARALDGTIRGDGVADSNVRDAVEREVRDLLEEDPAVFEPAAGDGTAGATETSAEGVDDPPESGRKPAAAGDGPSANDVGASADADAEVEADPDPEPKPEPEPEPEPEPAEDAGQKTLGDLT